ncbi:folylpolyglutamate synthase [Bacteroidia bacterium]|nr:folylpolyglutamate synthase [Bacteroidia bacterium]
MNGINQSATYQDTINYLFSQLPMFHRVGASAYKADLNNTIALLEACDNPQTKFRSVHVAGTNGKGSTAHLLASVCQESGYKTGLFTSPHLIDFRERIKINGRCISEERVTQFVERYKVIFDRIQPSFFEMTAMMAFEYFATEQVDIAIVEVGMGGRLDSTNLIQPLVSVITNIGLDHTQFLGDTLEKIAFEKAGIIKPQTPIIIGETHTHTAPVFIQTAARENAPIQFADTVIQMDTHYVNGQPLYDVFYNHTRLFHGMHCELTGIYQQQNIKTVMATLMLLKHIVPISDDAIIRGFAKVVTNTGLYGRWQIISRNPLVVCDTGHNVDGITQVIRQIDITPHQQLHWILGMVGDKDINAVLRLLPKNATYYFCQAAIPRALDRTALQQQAQSVGLSGQTYHSVKEALQQAQQQADIEDLIIVAGSTFIVAEIL